MTNQPRNCPYVGGLLVFSLFSSPSFLFASPALRRPILARRFPAFVRTLFPPPFWRSGRPRPPGARRASRFFLFLFCFFGRFSSSFPIHSPRSGLGCPFFFSAAPPALALLFLEPHHTTCSLPRTCATSLSRPPPAPPPRSLRRPSFFFVCLPPLFFFVLRLFEAAPLWGLPPTVRGGGAPLVKARLFTG